MDNQNEIIKRMLSERDFRIELVTKSHYWFCHFYFAHYITFPTAEFQKEIFGLTEGDARMIVIVAFRGSGKSTISTLSYPIWAILGKQQKKFVIILSQTQRQARQHLVNLKHELERNNLLLRDLGPFQEEQDEWGGYSLVVPKYNARITAASTEQSIRGLRHMQHRPDLIIADDIEDLQSVKTRENRDKTYNWLQGDIIPAGEQRTKIMVVGNLLHEDSVIMRLKANIEDGAIDGIFRAYPLIGGNDSIMWPGKYPSPESIESERKKIGSDAAWYREFLLKIIADENRVVYPEWIKHYDILPDKANSEYRYSATGIDLAISQSETADYTAMVSANIHNYGDEMKVYILPNPVNERLSSLETLERAKLVCKTIAGGSPTFLFVEEVGYQGSLIEHLKKAGLPAEGVKVHGQDKRARLSLVVSLIQSGQVLFPKKGAERLIEQLVGFGYEKHDDLADAFAILLHKIMVRNQNRPQPLDYTPPPKNDDDFHFTLDKEF